jgi:hypothetical protein
VANVLVLLELRHGAVLPVSLEALGQARRVATGLGATLYALVPLPEAPAYGEDDIIALCAQNGADKVVLLTDEGLGSEGEMRFGTHGRAVLAACEQLPPTLLLLGSSTGARDLAPRVAARLGAAYLPDGWVTAEGGRLQLCDRTGRSLSLEDEGGAGGLEHTVLVTVPPGRYQVARGADEAEMVIVAAPAGKNDFVEVLREHTVALTVLGAAPEGLPGRPTLPPVLVVAFGESGPPAPPVMDPNVVFVAVGEQAEADPRAHYALAVPGGEAAMVEALKRAVHPAKEDDGDARGAEIHIEVAAVDPGRSAADADAGAAEIHIEVAAVDAGGPGGEGA